MPLQFIKRKPRVQRIITKISLPSYTTCPEADRVTFMTIILSHLLKMWHNTLPQLTKHVYTWLCTSAYIHIPINSLYLFPISWVRVSYIPLLKGSFALTPPIYAMVPTRCCLTIWKLQLLCVVPCQRSLRKLMVLRWMSLDQCAQRCYSQYQPSIRATMSEWPSLSVLSHEYLYIGHLNWFHSFYLILEGRGRIFDCYNVVDFLRYLSFLDFTAYSRWK